MLSATLEEADPTVFEIIQRVILSKPFALIQLTRAVKEKRRQKHFINLIPSENFTSQSVLDALGSVMQSW